MHDLLLRIAAGLESGHYTNERAVSTSIVVPVLRLLGWDDADPVSVRPEFATGAGRVDYALFPRPGAPAVFLEVKGVGKSSEADQQLFQYAFHEGAQIAVLTDGRVWSFYLPGEHGSYDDRRVYQLDILERDPAECEFRFRRYLDRLRVVSGDALREARSDYSDKASRRKAEDTMPRAWLDMLSEPDADLMNILSERTEAMSGHRPTEAAIEKFLQAALIQLPQEKLHKTNSYRNSVQKAKNRLPEVPNIVQPLVNKLNELQHENVNSWKIGDIGGTEKDQVTTWVAFMSTLFTRYPDKQEQMAAAVRTRSRNNIARLVSDVYPKHPDLSAKQNKPLPGGWFIGTNESSATKLKISMQAVRACGLTWGRDAVLNFAERSE